MSCPAVDTALGPGRLDAHDVTSSSGHSTRLAVWCSGNALVSINVDDFLICYRPKHIHIIERHLQQCLNKLNDWTDTNGFKFSSAKTVCIHFCKLRKQHPDPRLLLNGSPIPVVEEAKFLGVIFDNKLSFLPHIRQLKANVLKP